MILLCGLGDLCVRSFALHPVSRTRPVSPTLAKIACASSIVGRRKSGSSRVPYHFCARSHACGIVIMRAARDAALGAPAIDVLFRPEEQDVRSGVGDVVPEMRGGDEQVDDAVAVGAAVLDTARDRLARPGAHGLDPRIDVERRRDAERVPGAWARYQDDRPARTRNAVGTARERRRPPDLDACPAAAR